MVALISMVCLIAVANFGDSMGHMFCDLYDNSPNAGSGGERAGLGLSTANGAGGQYNWDSNTHTCVKIGGGFGFGGGGFG